MKTERNTVPSWLMATLLGLLIIHVTGCASVSEGSDAMKRQALSFNPPPDKAAIYVIRPYNVLGSGAIMRVNLDYQEFGDVKIKSYLFAIIPPGEHVATGGDGSIKIEPFLAEAGKIYFFTIGPGWNGPEVKPISESEGKSYVQKFELSGDNRFDFQSLPGQNQQ